jgi:hypothetical protein
MLGNNSGAMVPYHTLTERHPYLNNSCVCSAQNEIDVYSQLEVLHIELNTLPQIQRNNVQYEAAVFCFGMKAHATGIEFEKVCLDYPDSLEELAFLDRTF